MQQLINKISIKTVRSVCYKSLAILFFQIVMVFAAYSQNEADEYLRLAERFIQEGNKTEAVQYYNKAAYVYWNANQSSKAIECFKKLLSLNEEFGNSNAILTITNNLGLIYSELEDYHNAAENFKLALKYSRTINDKPGIVSALINVGTSLQGLNKDNEAINYLTEAVNLSNELSDLKLMRKSYGALAESYEKLGNSSKAFENYEIFASIDKKIKKQEMEEVQNQAETEVNKANSEKMMTEQQLSQTSQVLKMTTDTLQKTLEIKRLQELELDLKSAELREKEIILQKRLILSIFLASAAILITLILILLYIQFQNKKRANELLARQNEEINRQRDKLDRQNKNITSSIHYATTIQQAILPSKDVMDNYIESFIIYRPKDLVSGDFYWFSQWADPKTKKEVVLLAVVDCTGHGVPGAFMSMIGSRLLNEIVNEKKVLDPKDILRQLCIEVKAALKQDKSDNTDGMDMCLCSLEKNNKGETKVVFSGAKRPMFYHMNDMPTLGILKGDRISIGGSNVTSHANEFTNQEIILPKGSMIYLASDGIIDQHSPERKRFGSNKLIDTIYSVVNKPLTDQKIHLEKILDDFSGNEEQRDDITVLGVRLI
jgi:serine phosphatase RsbU (regulator of sigma subunit)